MRTFKPWKGKEYECYGLFGVKILLLGESHYGTCESESDKKIFTKKVVCSVIEEKDKAGNKKKRPFFTKILRLVTLKQVVSTEESRKEFWNKVAFYNYIQEFVPKRKPPTKKMWANAGDHLLETIEELKPNVIVVLGVRLRKHLLANLGKDKADKKFAIVKHSDGGISYKKNGHHIMFAMVKHPAGGMSYDKNRPKVECALAKAGVSKAVLDANPLRTLS